MSRGKSLTPDQQDALLDTYGQTGSYDTAALAAGCSSRTARRYLMGVEPVVTKVVTAGMLKTTEDISAATLRLLAPLFEEAMKPEKIAAATVKELGTTIGIIVDKYLLLTGQATSRTDNTSKINIEVRAAAERLAQELGMSVEDVLAEAESVLRETTA